MTTSFLQNLSSLHLRRRPRQHRPDLASQWQLMWWKFRTHKMAMVGLVLLGMFVLLRCFAESIGPYPPAAARSDLCRGRAACASHMIDADRRTSTCGRSSTAPRRARHDHAAA